MRTAKALFDNLTHMGFRPTGCDDVAETPVVYFANGLQVEISPDDEFVIVMPGAVSGGEEGGSPTGMCRCRRLADLAAELATRLGDGSDESKGLPETAGSHAS